MNDLLFSDGGVIGPNPSRLGGTWAWCLIRDGALIQHGSGLLLPEDVGLPTISNNDTELYAAIRALEVMQPKWNGVLCTDSQVTLHRLNTPSAKHTTPEFLRRRCWELRRALRYTIRLHAGHPTRKELAEGKRQRNGLPTSPWNVWCDKECTRLATLFKTTAS